MLLDTTTLIDLNRKYPDSIQSFKKLLNNQESSIVVKYELLVGCKNKREQTNIVKLTQEVGVNFLPITPEISVLADQLILSFHLSNGVGIRNALIAATAIFHNQELATHNTKHFDFIPNLKLLKPY